MWGQEGHFYTLTTASGRKQRFTLCVPFGPDLDATVNIAYLITETASGFELSEVVSER